MKSFGMFSPRNCLLIFFITVGFKKCNCYSNITDHYNWNLLDHENCGESLSDKIIGGKVSSLGQFPWLARIGYNIKLQDSDYLEAYEDYFEEPTFRCAGSLINKLYVLTAAHCVTNIPPKFFVSGIRLGENFANDNIDCDDKMCAPPTQNFRPSQIITHSDYDHPKFRNDIALIRLNQTVIYHAFVQPICLPWGSQENHDYIGSSAEVAGWGIRNIVTQDTSPYLLYVTMPVVPLDLCQKAFKKYTELSDDQLCVGGTVGKDSCGGDSGGPLMQPSGVHGSPRYYVIGVVSFGSKRCGGSTTPAVYTNVGRYLSWILDNMKP